MPAQYRTDGARRHPGATRSRRRDGGIDWAATDEAATRMPKLPRLSPPLAVVLATAAALLAVVAMAVVLALAFRNLHRNTVALLGERLEVALALIAEGLDPTLSPTALSRRIDRLALHAGGVAFVLDAENRLVAHPQIASGLLKPGLPARRADAIIAAFLSPKARLAALDGAGFKGALVEVRDDDYGVALRPFPGRADWRLGVYLLRPSALDLIAPALRPLQALLAAALVVALLSWGFARYRLKPLGALTRAVEGMAGPEPTAVASLADAGGPELRRAAQAINRLREVVRIYDGLLPRALARRLATAPGALRPRRSEITVLATGLAGFAEVAGALDDEAAVELLRRHLTLLSGRIQASGGSLVEVRGDGVLAYWGVPESGPEGGAGGHAVRALQAARAIARLVEAENDRRRAEGLAPLALCLGIAGGEALVGDLGPAGRITLTALGPPVALARRLERACRARAGTDGAVRCLVSQATLAAADAGAGEAADLPDELAGTAARALEL